MKNAHCWILAVFAIAVSTATVQARCNYMVTNGTVTITKYTGSDEDVVIPSEITGLPVTGIGRLVFSENANLTSVTIPDSVAIIGDCAFSYCPSLTSLTIPNSVTSIGWQAFEACTSLTSITIPQSVTSIDEQPFTGCTHFTAVNVNVLSPFYTSVDGVLFNKSQTTLIQFPGAKVGDYTIPNSVTNIGYGAFWDCTNLTRVTILHRAGSLHNSRQSSLVPGEHQQAHGRVVLFQRFRVDELSGSVLSGSAVVIHNRGMRGI